MTHDAAVKLLAERWNWSAEGKDGYEACGKAIRGWRKEHGKYIQYGRDMYAEYIWLLKGRISKNQLMQEAYGTRWMKKHYPDVLPPVDQKDVLNLLSRRWNYEMPQFCKDEIKRLELEYKQLFSD